MLKQLKHNLFYILIGLFIAGIVIIIYSTFYNPKNYESKFDKEKNEELLSIINENIDFQKEMLPDSLKIDEEKDLSNLINEALDNSIKEDHKDVDKKENTNQENDENTLANAINNKNNSTKFENIVMISSDKFDCDYNGQRHSFRLIGIKDDGNPDGVKSLIENIKNVNIEYDSLKAGKDGRELIYLWDGEHNNDKSNLINLQIILNKYAITTYLNTRDMTIEVPNNKYATTFIKYQKYINQQ